MGEKKHMKSLKEDNKYIIEADKEEISDMLIMNFENRKTKKNLAKPWRSEAIELVNKTDQNITDTYDVEFPFEIYTIVKTWCQAKKLQLAQVVERRQRPNSDEISEFEYYVHFKGTNRRLDEWK